MCTLWSEVGGGVLEAVCGTGQNTLTLTHCHTKLHTRKMNVLCTNCKAVNDALWPCAAVTISIKRMAKPHTPTPTLSREMVDTN